MIDSYWIDPAPALVHGYAARALAVFLREDLGAGRFDRLPPAGREQAVRALRAIERAGEEWLTSVGSVCGTSEHVGVEVGSRWMHDELSIDEAAGILDVSPRRMRTMAAEGLGRKVGSRWLLDRAAVLAELERRTAA